MNINNNIPCVIYNCADMERTTAGYSESFIQEASRQLTTIIESGVGESGLSKKGYNIHFYFGQKTIYVNTGDIVFVCGYYYHRAALCVDNAWVCDLWVRWEFKKSVKKTHNDDINPGEIAFSICTKLPIEVGLQFKLNYSPDIKSIQCVNWKKVLKNALYWREHPITEIDTAPKTIKKEESGLPFDYTISCDWPDVIVRLYLINSKSDDIKHQVEALFSEFINEWNYKHKNKENIIHDCSLSENENYDSENDSRLISIYVDFGSSNPDSVLKKLLKSLSKSGLELEKVIFS